MHRLLSSFRSCSERGNMANRLVVSYREPVNDRAVPFFDQHDIHVPEETVRHLGGITG